MFPKERTNEELAYIRVLATNIAVENQSRGRDSTGFATFGQRGIGLFKHPLPATKLTDTKAYVDFMKKSVGKNTKSILIHTRAGTKGSEKNNLNNHPIESARYIGVHNGIIYNDDELFNEMKLFRAAQVDSEVIFRLLDTIGEKPEINGMKWVAEKLCGAFTTAFVAKKERDKLHLIRNDNPVTLVYIEQLNIIAFASQKQYLIDAIKDANGYTSITVKDGSCDWVEPAKQTIWSFDMTKDTALEQIRQKPYNFTENWDYGYNVYGRGGDWWNGEDGSFFRGGAAEVAHKQEEEISIASILTKLSEEELEWFDRYVDVQTTNAWTEGWTKGRESLGDEMEHKVGIAYEEGFKKGFDEGFYDGSEYERDIINKEKPVIVI